MKTERRKLVEWLDTDERLLQALCYHYRATFDPLQGRSLSTTKGIEEALVAKGLLEPRNGYYMHPCTELGQQILHAWAEANEKRIFKIGNEYYEPTRVESEGKANLVVAIRQLKTTYTIFKPKAKLSTLGEVSKLANYHHYHYLKPYQPLPIQEEMETRYLVTDLTENQE